MFTGLRYYTDQDPKARAHHNPHLHMTLLQPQSELHQLADDPRPHRALDKPPTQRTVVGKDRCVSIRLDTRLAKRVATTHSHRPAEQTQTDATLEAAALLRYR